MFLHHRLAVLKFAVNHEREKYHLDLRASPYWGQAGTWLLTRSHVVIERLPPLRAAKVLRFVGEWEMFCGAMQSWSGRTLAPVA